jgi:hypothetical protein
MIELSTATFCWMLQCISPHLTIDQTAFHAYMAQYQRWLARVRYACTFHHETWLDWAASKIPNIPLINPAPDPLGPPKRDPPHQHPDFDYGYGTGPIVDSFTKMYYLNGSATRVPGHCSIEMYDEDEKEYKLTEVNGYGQTNEYIHPICHYRRIMRGPEPHDPLGDFERFFEESPDKKGEGRFWWRKKGDREDQKLPEWMILEHVDEGEVNFERSWYHMCEKDEAKLEKLRREGYEKDWLECLDEKNDFGVGRMEGWVYP